MDQGQVVKDPKRSALRRRHEILFSFMYCKVRDRDDRKIELH
jgi:hypothetical protein